MSDIFISYSSEDEGQAKQLSGLLERDGFSVFLACKDIEPGDDWDEEIDRALRNVRCVVLCWSRAAFRSGMVKNEVQKADSRQIAVVPVLLEGSKILEDAPLPLGVGQLQFADLSRWQGGRDSAYTRLVKSVRSRVGRPGSATAAAPSARPFALETTWRSAVGGCLGGLTTGLILGLAYYRGQGGGPGHIVAATLFAAVAGGLLFLAAEITSRRFAARKLSTRWTSLFCNEATGGIVGGVIAGIVLGPFGSMYFYSLGGQVPNAETWIGLTAVLGGIFIATLISAGNTFARPNHWEEVLVAVLASVIPAFFVGVFLKFSIEPLYPKIFVVFVGEDEYLSRLESLPFGAFFLGVIGFVVGASIGLSKLLLHWLPVYRGADSRAIRTASEVAPSSHKEQE